MEKIIQFINGLSWQILVIGSLTLGLAPFVPEPHLVEKIRMLVKGTLSRPIDIFDLLLHAILPLLLLIKLISTLFRIK